MYVRLYEFIRKSEIQYSHPFGLHSWHSASHALISTINFVTCASDSKKYSGSVFLDLQKAFDSVNSRA